MHQGVLSLRIPKQPAPEPKRVPIKEGSTKQMKPGRPS